ncbi:MAG: dTMP kinase [Thermogemmata sp.]|jgi:dTMP kinase|nr:dTMP kinase [Gemmataceae bacterium]
MSKPLFISLDGIDGTGKTTQLQRLAQWLREQHVPVVTSADPGGTLLGEELRRLLLHRSDLSLTPVAEALLFMAARAQLVVEVIRPALSAGQCVLCDRFLLANVVYQGYAGGLDPEELWRIGRWSASGVEPDLTLVLDLEDVSLARRRKGRFPPGDRFEQRDEDYQRQLRDGFRREAQRQPQRIALVPADGDVEEVQRHLRKLLLPLFHTHGWNLTA